MPVLSSRDGYIDYLGEVSDGLRPDGGRRANLVKSYIVETAREHRGFTGAPDALAAGLPGTAQRVGDSTMFLLQDAEGDVLAVVDGAESRFPVVHSTIAVEQADRVVRSAVMGSPHLDHVWLPGRFFDGLWDWTRETAAPGRIAKLVFDFHGRFEQSDDSWDRGPDGQEVDGYGEVDEDLQEAGGYDEVDEDLPDRETRRSHFAVEDRVDVLERKLQTIRNAYDPLQSTVRMRIPSGGRGGHEVYNDGKITNRSASFTEQLKVVELVTGVYRSVTEGVEDRLWYSTADEHGAARLAGSPVLLEFPEPIELEVLHRWADLTFGGRRNWFRLGGEPMWSGKDRTRLHVYGVDRHLWQPITLEATRNYFLLLLPEGTCGNTVNRLVTRVQGSLCPTVRTWLGDRQYEEVLASAAPLSA